MKKLVISPGGMPLHLQDFEFMYEGLIEALAGHNWRTNCVLQGCELTKNGSDFEIAEGWVYVDGEIFYVPAHTVVDNDGSGNKSYDATNYDFSHDPNSGLDRQSFLDNFGYEMQVDYRNTGSDTFHDSVVRDTYEIRTMEGRHYVNQAPTTGDANYLSIAGRTYEEVIADKFWDRSKLPVADTNNGIDGYIKDSLRYYSYRYTPGSSYGNDEIIEFSNNKYITLTLKSGTSWSAYNNEFPKAKMGIDGRVMITGKLDSSSVSDPTFFDGSGLPASFKPNDQKQIPISEVTSSGSSPGQNGMLIINTDGSMEIYCDTFGNNWSLDGSEYKPL